MGSKLYYVYCKCRSGCAMTVKYDQAGSKHGISKTFSKGYNGWQSYDVDTCCWITIMTRTKTYKYDPLRSRSFSLTC